MTAPAQRRTHQFTIGDRLRKAREEAGLSQDELAERIEVSRGTISNYETGATRPQRIVMRAWAMATSTDYDWLASGFITTDGGRTSLAKSYYFGRRATDLVAA